MHGLRKRCPALPGRLSLKDSLAALRRGQGVPVGQKVLIVLDQFEQWLHAKKDENSELVQALRQCDGGRVQCIVMVRDDFWMAATRFMRDLEVPLLEAHNSAAVDLFLMRHAEKVLTAFGSAYGTLPDNPNDTSNHQKLFIKESVAGLAEEGKVICVRLTLFAEMMKGKVWTPAALKEVGGTQGVGVTFLEETFSASTSPPEHRYHQNAARAVLKELLPDIGSDIKGGMRSTDALLEASGYGRRPKDFDDLIRILDSEIRLITPTDPEGQDADNNSVTQALKDEKYFQLTHDYLVPALRQWLTHKQKETRKGRAELKLAERSALWNARPENRYLPSLVEWLNTRALTESKQWSAPQRVMMSHAFRVHGLWSSLVSAVFLALLGFAALQFAHERKLEEVTRVEGLVGRLASAEPSQVSQIIKELEANPNVAATFLNPLVLSAAETANEKRAQLHARLATVSRDSSLVEPLLEELLTNKVAYVGPIRQQLRPYAGELTEKLQLILRGETIDPNRRFRAAVMLADYIPQSQPAFWTETDLRFVAWHLVTANAEFQPLLREYLRPIRGRLLASLETIFGDPKATDAQRLGAANAFADYAGGDIEKLSKLLVIADSRVDMHHGSRSFAQTMIAIGIDHVHGLT